MCIIGEGQLSALHSDTLRFSWASTNTTLITASASYVFGHACVGTRYLPIQAIMTTCVELSVRQCGGTKRQREVPKMLLQCFGYNESCISSAGEQYSSGWDPRFYGCLWLLITSLRKFTATSHSTCRTFGIWASQRRYSVGMTSLSVLFRNTSAPLAFDPLNSCKTKTLRLLPSRILPLSYYFSYLSISFTHFHFWIS